MRTRRLPWTAPATAVLMTAAWTGAAAAQWTVVRLHPFPAHSFAFGGHGGQQGGYVWAFGTPVSAQHAALWNSTPGSYINLHPPGWLDSRVWGVHSGQQVGQVQNPGGSARASLWTGSAASWTDLTPPGAAIGVAMGVWAGEQVGYVFGAQNLAPTFGRIQACRWNGTAASWVSLHPWHVSSVQQSRAYATDGVQQAGVALIGLSLQAHASLWTGTGASWVDLHPAGAIHSEANGVHAGQQVGRVSFGPLLRAWLWNGSAGSSVDLHPTAAIGPSWARAVHAGQQVGSTVVPRPGGGSVGHASLWSGNAASWVDLHQHIPPEFGLEGSDAYAIWQDGPLTYIAGHGATGGSPGVIEALLWIHSAAPADSDGDGLTDDAETGTHGTNPQNPDTDGDGLSDGAEVNTHATDPNDADSDDDGASDGAEVAAGSDPNNASPIADAGLDAEVEAVSAAGAVVQLNGTGSYDPDAGDTIAYHWDVSNHSVFLNDPSSPTPFGLFPVGATVATLTVSDGHGGFDTADVLVVVRDTTPPRVLCIADTSSLWPPNHTMRNVRLLITGIDAVTQPDQFVIESVSLRCDEPDNAQGNGDGDTTGDTHGADGYSGFIDATPLFVFDPAADVNGAWVATVQLRAERAGGGDGRCYSVDARVADGAGNVTTVNCCIVVPHNQ